MALLDDIKVALTSAGVIDGSAWVGFLGYLPAVPDQVVVVNETPGGIPDQTSVTAHTFPSFQVVVRGQKEEYNIARARLQLAFDALNNATISGYTYIFANQSGPLPLGVDEKDRPILSQNYVTMKLP